MLPPIWARNGTRQRSLSPCWWYVHCPLPYIVVWTRHGVYCLANTCQLRGTMSACIARPTTESALASPYSSQRTIWQLDTLHLCEGRICFNQDWYSRQNYSWKLYASKDTLAWENPVQRWPTWLLKGQWTSLYPYQNVVPVSCTHLWS